MTTTVRLLSAEEVAAVYGRSLAAIHVMAHRKKWRRIKHGGRVYYNLDDVDKTLGRG